MSMLTFRLRSQRKQNFASTSLTSKYQLRKLSLRQKDPIPETRCRKPGCATHSLDASQHVPTLQTSRNGVHSSRRRDRASPSARYVPPAPTHLTHQLTPTSADALKFLLRIQTSTILAAPSTRALLTTGTAATRQKNETLLARADAQLAHKQQSLYRACASLTTFRARDPDPNAVDDGAILGLRIEVVSRAKFLRPYYVLLNRPYGSRSRHLRVHRHTVPPCIPLAGLAARYLAPPPASGDEEGGKQNLAKFARALRRELVYYHHRLGVVADLRKAAGLGKKATGDGEEGGGEDEEGSNGRLVDISAADAEAKQISIQWADGRTGRLVMGDDGEIVKVVAVGDHGRDREAVRQLFGDAKTVGEVARRLAEP